MAVIYILANNKTKSFNFLIGCYSVLKSGKTTAYLRYKFRKGY
ncbi:hypothetical protein XCR1_1680004 [Xenorhabdus cabanillasii JM26]|uniref:Uncharacterized protein n=2 Tax=Xenorhabdus cabanillasii TaxID=351673 RepID=A0A3D9U808_9GAMM|nr:hypothetical protein Xcab_04141 [Xenorhabdus cabanillasii JM26]REF25559.1 hypothetical protein BDD26_0050 [Xenorhabdus cabanillasii]CDL82501.1 hypothetical protein XCR1_1680004 [Xenorhabdus cabanillasii JM26]